jgi:mevalonate kinase
MTESIRSTRGFGHGKVILLGEHAVVFGQPALAAGLGKGIAAEATPGTGRITIAPWTLSLHRTEKHPVCDAVNAIAQTLGADNFDLDIAPDLPGGAGLGSSAAMAVAVARALSSDGDGKRIDAAILASERIFHANPSGIDAAAATSGGVGRFTRETGWRPIAVRQPVKLCVGFSGVKRQTSTLVEHVTRLCRVAPVASRMIETLGALSEAGIACLENGDVDGLGRLFNMAHGVLSGLGVSTPELEALVRGARSAGAIGAKLTGAGGGGAVIAIAPSHRQDVLAAWQSEGFEGFATEIGFST